MVTPLAGLTGLYGPPDPESHGRTGRDPSNWGLPASPRHGVPGDSSAELAYRGTAYGAPVGDLTASEPLSGAGVGEVLDRTPNVHSAPYPKGVEQDPCVWGDTSADLHGYDLGGPRRAENAAVPDQQIIESGIYPSPQQSVLAGGTPSQLRGGKAGKDVDQGDGIPNTGTFQLGHEFYLRSKNPVPRNWSTIHGGERPFYGAHPSAWQARFDGDDSMYAHAGNTSVEMNLSPTPVGYPTPYEPPADPTIAPVTGYYGTEAPVINDGWVAG